MKPVIHSVREIGSNRITFTLPSWHQNNSFDRLLRSLALLTVLFFKLESNMLMVSHVSVCQFSTNQLYQEEKKALFMNTTTLPQSQVIIEQLVSASETLIKLSYGHLHGQLET